MTISINRLTNDLKDMKSDLLLVKNAAQHILNKVSDFKPDDVMDAGQGDMSQEDKSAISPAMDAGDNTGGSAPDEQGGMPGDEKGGDMNKAPNITTPEEAKTTLHDAIKDLKGVVVQATGLDANSTTAKAIIGSFKALRSFADFEAKGKEAEETSEDKEEESEEVVPPKTKKAGTEKESPINLKLGYTINLNLPATSDIAVFNAIFKSLRDHLLD